MFISWKKKLPVAKTVCDNELQLHAKPIARRLHALYYGLQFRPTVK